MAGYETKKEQINYFLKSFSKEQIQSVPEDVLLADMSIKLSVKNAAIREFLNNYLTLGLIDKDPDGYYGVSARQQYDQKMRQRAEEFKKEMESAPKTTKEALDYVKSLGDPDGDHNTKGD
jgi:hypothetical protein